MNTMLNIAELRQRYLDGSAVPQDIMQGIRERSAEYADRHIWIHLLTEAEQSPWLDALANKPIADHPLWGIPFAIKDNIDLAGIPTTAACPAFSFVPKQSAFVVQQLIDAGAIPVGKTNLDQFATGLNGTRSPYGACRNAFNPAYISGGSSSGSAVSVALGLAAFSLGTDTAGSGRVPAAFNNLVGVKPSLGLLSASGMTPACRSLDCMTIFALDSDDANTVLNAAIAYDQRDAYSRENPFSNNGRHYGSRQGPLKIGVLPITQLKFFGDESYAEAYQHTLEQLTGDDIELVEIDYSAFDEAARMLYEGPWVAERYLACQPLIDEQPEALHPVVRGIVEQGKTPSAATLFSYQYRLKGLAEKCLRSICDVDCLLTPTAGKLFTVDEMLAEPVRHNSELGYYTNFMNLCDMAAIALPTVFTDRGLPFGITLSSKTFSDRALLSIAKRLEQLFKLPLGTSSTMRSNQPSATVSEQTRVELVVCGAHLDGLPLNWQLRERGAHLVCATQSAENYRLYALAGGPVARPGMVRDTKTGQSIAVEVWSIPTEELGSFVAAIPEPLGIGKVELSDGSWKCGFICEASGLAGATDITEHGGWRSWLEGYSTRSNNKSQTP